MWNLNHKSMFNIFISWFLPNHPKVIPKNKPKQVIRTKNYGGINFIKFKSLILLIDIISFRES